MAVGGVVEEQGDGDGKKVETGGEGDEGGEGDLGDVEDEIEKMLGLSLF